MCRTVHIVQAMPHEALPHVRMPYNKLSCNLAYYKASLVKVIYILIIDAVLSLCLLYKLKPAPN
jgi:hypothetical protein